MNNTVDKAKGKVQEVSGKVTGDKELEVKGKLNQKIASTKEGIEETVEDSKEKMDRKRSDVLDKMDISNNE
jgi:uncharacterized protein YjbJ (UPF0337 family)